MLASTDHCPSIAISNQYVSVSSIVLGSNDLSLANLLLFNVAFVLFRSCARSCHTLCRHLLFFFLYYVSLLCTNAECCLPCFFARAWRPFSLVLLQCDASDVTARPPRFLRRALKFRSILWVFLFFFVSFSSSTLTSLCACTSTPVWLGGNRASCIYCRCDAHKWIAKYIKLIRCRSYSGGQRWSI